METTVVALDAEDAVRIRRAVARLSRKLSATASSGSLSPSEASILGLIVSREPIGLSELIELEHIHPTMLSRIVRRLDSDGLVERKPKVEDRRSAILTPTSRGRELNDRLRVRRAELLLEGFRRLSLEGQRRVEAALSDLELLADLVSPDDTGGACNGESGSGDNVEQ